MTPFDLDIWAKTIYGEARGESEVGKLAVAYVILNRWVDKRWPGRISEVCLQDKQFSAWDDSNVKKMAIVDPVSTDYLKCMKAALTAYLRLEDDPTGANHYAVVGTHPYWAKGHGKIIGNHEFWNL